MKNHDDRVNILKKCLFNYLCDTDKDVTIESIELKHFAYRNNGYCHAVFSTDKYKMGSLFIVAFYPNDMMVYIHEYPMAKTHSNA